MGSGFEVVAPPRVKEDSGLLLLAETEGPEQAARLHFRCTLWCHRKCPHRLTLECNPPCRGLGEVGQCDWFSGHLGKAWAGETRVRDPRLILASRWPLRLAHLAVKQGRKSLWVRPVGSARDARDRLACGVWGFHRPFRGRTVRGGDSYSLRTCPCASCLPEVRSPGNSPWITGGPPMECGVCPSSCAVMDIWGWGFFAFQKSSPQTGMGRD